MRSLPKVWRTMIKPGEIFGLVELEKHTGDDTGNGMEEAVKQGAVIEEKRAEIFVNGEDAVTVGHAD